MSTEASPLHARLRAGLEWPPWSEWPAQVVGRSIVAFETESVDHEERRREVEARLGLAKSIGEGGPYLDIFDQRAHSRLSDEAGQPLGPLWDFTFAIKDLIAVEGRRVSAGSRVRHDAPAETATAPIVRDLEALGAIATGAVTLHEFAFGVTGVNPYAGTAPNPKAPGRMPGGSSAGSAAAVADGSARIALGTDTGGSVRIPASFCGVVGYKPSVGLYPADGVFPLSTTLDHVGLFATSMADIVRAHRGLGHAGPTGDQVQRLGVARSDLDAADSDVRAAIDGALSRIADQGIEIVDIALPDPESTFVASTTIMFPEAAGIHAASLATHRDRYGDDIRTRLELGATLTGPEVAAAHQLRRQLTAEVLTTLRDVDVIVGPTTPIVAPLLSEADDPNLPARIVANTRLGNVVGLPAVSLPVAVSGPPVGLQLLGSSDSGLLAAAQRLETIVA